jgi:hypothetical protein
VRRRPTLDHLARVGVELLDESRQLLRFIVDLLLRLLLLLLRLLLPPLRRFPRARESPLKAARRALFAAPHSIPHGPDIEPHAALGGGSCERGEGSSRERNATRDGAPT